MKLLGLLFASLAFHGFVYADRIVSAKSGGLSDTLRYFIYIVDSPDGPYVQFRMANVSTTIVERFWEVHSQFLLQVDGPGEKRRSDQDRQFFFDFRPHRKVLASDLRMLPADFKSHSVELVTPVTRKRFAELFPNDPAIRNGPSGFTLSEPGTYVVRLFARRNGVLRELEQLKFRYAEERMFADAGK